MIQLQSDQLAVVVSPEEGAEVRFLGRPGGLNALFWANWAAPLPANRSLTYGDSRLDWLSRYRGGWQELFPNAGTECTVFGVPLPFHGEASTARWETLRSGESELVLRTAARLPLILERHMKVEDGVLRMRERVTNESDLVVPFVWGHHPAFSTEAGARIDLPTARVHVIRDGANLPLDPAAGPEGNGSPLSAIDGDAIDLSRVPDGAVDRYVCLTELAGTWAAVRDIERGVGVGLAWDRAAFPCLWLWQQIHGGAFPWYGRSTITALEPSTAWPDDGLARAIERGQAHQIAPRGSMDAWLTVALFDPDERRVASVNRLGAVRLARR